MLYRGFEIKGSWPPGQDVKVLDKEGNVIKSFPFVTKDETIMEWIDGHRASNRRR